MGQEGEITRENELSKVIIGFAFNLYNSLGYGLPEKVYQKALEVVLQQSGLEYRREKYGKIVFDGVVIGKYFLDFLIEDKLAIELKVRNEIYTEHVSQLLNYLKSNNLRLGLLIAFSKSGVLIKRVIN